MTSQIVIHSFDFSRNAVLLAKHPVKQLYHRTKGTRKWILLRCFIPHRGLPMGNRWSQNGLDMWGGSLVSFLFFVKSFFVPGIIDGTGRDFDDRYRCQSEVVKPNWTGRQTGIRPLDWHPIGMESVPLSGRNEGSNTESIYDHYILVMATLQ